MGWGRGIFKVGFLGLRPPISDSDLRPLPILSGRARLALGNEIGGGVGLLKSLADEKLRHGA